jgi:hypothetical protein
MNLLSKFWFISFQLCVLKQVFCRVMYKLVVHYGLHCSVFFVLHNEVQNLIHNAILCYMLLYHILILLRISHRWFYFTIFSLVVWYDCISNFGPKGPIHLKYLLLCRFMRTCLGWNALTLKGLSNTGLLTELSGLLGSRKRGPLLKGRTCEIWDLANICYAIVSDLCTVLDCTTPNFNLRNSRIY